MCAVKFHSRRRGDAAPSPGPIRPKEHGMRSIRTQCESRRQSGATSWIEPLENRTLMAAHGAAESVALKGAPSSEPTVTKLVTGLASGSGSTVGPNGDLYVTEGKTGKVLEINPRTG